MLLINIYFCCIFAVYSHIHILCGAGILQVFIYEGTPYLTDHMEPENEICVL